jgi:hypothetical protein
LQKLFSLLIVLPLICVPINYAADLGRMAAGAAAAYPEIHYKHFFYGYPTGTPTSSTT